MSGTPVMLDMPAFARFLEERPKLRCRRRNGYSGPECLFRPFGGFYADTEKAMNWARRLGVLFTIPGVERDRHFADMQRLEAFGGPLARKQAEVYYEAAE